MPDRWQTKTEMHGGVLSVYRGKTLVALSAVGEESDTAEMVRRANAFEELVEACKGGLEVIRVWHDDDFSWPLYRDNAPELEPLREALQKASESDG